MHILYLTDRLSSRGGASNHLIEVISYASQQAQVTVAAGDIQAPLPSHARSCRLRGLSASTMQTRGLSGLTDLMDAADVIHVQNVMNPWVLGAARDTGRAVITVQDHRVFCPGPGKTMPDGQPCLQPMPKAACEQCLSEPDYHTRMRDLTQARADAISGAKLVVLSQYMANELAAIGLPGAQIIPPPVTTAARPSPAGEGFLVGGRLVHHKGIDLAADAWRQAQVDSELMVAGLGPMLDEVPDATHLGWLDGPQLKDALNRTRALIFPSRWQEPFGILAVEALAQGTPVIAMVQGGMADWADAGVLTIAPGDVQGMAEAIKTLHAQPDLAAQLGATGWQMVQERYTPAHIHTALWEIYTATAQP